MAWPGPAPLRRAARGAGRRGCPVTIRLDSGVGVQLFPGGSRGADAVVFIFEFTTYIDLGDGPALTTGPPGGVGVPRRRRVVIDCDGAYNDAIRVGRRREPPERGGEPSLDRRVRQPRGSRFTSRRCRPLRPNVRPFFFHALQPGVGSCRSTFRDKRFGMVYVGNNWFRWRALRRVLEAVEPIRPRGGAHRAGGPWLGRRAVLGRTHGYRATQRTTPTRATCGRLGVEMLPPVRFDRVDRLHGRRGVLARCIYRPLFDHLRLVTCRTFETPAANTIPAVRAGRAVRDARSTATDAAELVLPDARPAGQGPGRVRAARALRRHRQPDSPSPGGEVLVRGADPRARRA